jgi:two-component system, NarL family, sensor histidine kinase UhpB
MGTGSENFNILVVEDNPSDYYLIEQMLRSSRLTIQNIHSADRLSKAKEILQQHTIGLVLLDLSLPDSLGINTFLELRPFAQRIPIIILTGLADSEVALEALKQNAQDYLVKGEFNVNLLTKSIEYSIERKKTEEKTQASEEKYRQMFYKNPFPMWVNELDSLRIVEVNDAAIQKYGYKREEFLSLTLKDIQQSLVPASPFSVTDTGQGKLWKHQKKNGDEIIVEFTYYPIDYFGRTAMQAQINDVTEKIRMENELTLKKQQIVEAILTAQENERKGIGEELHDNINQILSAVKLSLEVALEFPEKRTVFIAMCMEHITLAIEEIRKLSKSLILSGNLQAFGLVQSIDELVKHNLSVTKLAIHFTAENLDEALLSEEQKISIYRIIQEQLNNILKYAAASSVTISLHTMGEQIILLIADDGKGFDTTMQRKGIGITNIINRAELFNGKVKIDSSPGNGCRLEVVLNAKTILPREAA